MKFVRGRRDEVEPQIKCLCRFILGVGHDSAAADEFRCLKAAKHRILQQTSTQTGTLLRIVHSQPRKKSDWHRILSETMSNPRRNFVTTHRSGSQCVVSHQTISSEGYVGSGRTILMIQEGVSLKIFVKGGHATIEVIRSVISADRNRLT
jgi:homoaconitase/3-isopropylmalate dehydratase large subunit